MYKIFICLILSSLCLRAQDSRIKIGTRSGCSGRGICTIESVPESSKKSSVSFKPNASIVHTEEGATLLRVYRDKMTRKEQDNILGAPITSANSNVLKFVMEESLPLEHTMSQSISGERVNRIKMLAAKSYPTFITKEYIDITIITAEPTKN